MNAQEAKAITDDVNATILKRAEERAEEILRTVMQGVKETAGTGGYSFIHFVRGEFDSRVADAILFRGESLGFKVEVRGSPLHYWLVRFIWGECNMPLN